jgi:Uma2 family endonuclease
MTIASLKLPEMTLAEYLDYDDGTGRRHELVDGVLVDMGNESKLNLQIAMFLLHRLVELGVSEDFLSVKIEIVVSSRKVKVRYPDLVVLTPGLEAQMADSYRCIIQSAMPPPAMVAEVVSPGEPQEENYQRDYVDKVNEYAARGIPEYWIIDPNRSLVLVLTLLEGEYESVEFRGNARIVSPMFPNFSLTVKQLLNRSKPIVGDITENPHAS